MKITILQGAFLPVPALRGGAIEKAWDALGQSFSMLGHEVTHISRKYQGLPNDEWIGKVHHIRVNGFESVNHSILLKIKEFFYVLNARRVLPQADILVTHAFWAPILLDKKKFGKIYIHVGRFPKGQMKIYLNASRFQVPTRAIAEAVKKEIPNRENEISILPYPLAWKVNSCPSYSDKQSRILFLGRIHPEKGVVELVNAFNIMTLKGRKDYKLIIRGPWRDEEGGGGKEYYSKVKKAAKNSEGTVEILEPTFSIDELMDELMKTKIFVYPSFAEKGETFGLAVLEAMSLGCVPIVSSLDCFQDLVEDQKNGYVFNHRSQNMEKDLSFILQNAIQSNEKNIKFSTVCFNKSKEYEIEKLSIKYINDFKLLLEKDL